MSLRILCCLLFWGLILPPSDCDDIRQREEQSLHSPLECQCQHSDTVPLLWGPWGRSCLPEQQFAFVLWTLNCTINLFLSLHWLLRSPEGIFVLLFSPFIAQFLHIFYLLYHRHLCTPLQTWVFFPFSSFFFFRMRNIVADAFLPFDFCNCGELIPQWTKQSNVELLSIFLPQGFLQSHQDNQHKYSPEESGSWHPTEKPSVKAEWELAWKCPSLLFTGTVLRAFYTVPQRAPRQIELLGTMAITSFDLL